MSFARPWWLLALALLIPLVILHLRRPALALREVSSLDIWERLAASAQSTSRRLRPPRYPWILALQALALASIAVALAGPDWHGSPPPPTTVYVADGSVWMHVGTRLADARRAVRRLAAADPGSRVALIDATGTPSVVYRGPRSGLDSAVAKLAASAGAGDLPGGIALGAGLLGGSKGRLVVLHAPENTLPVIAATRGQVDAQVIGSPTADQGIFGRGVRCGVGASASCEVVAAVRNGGGASRIDRYAAYVNGKRATTLGVAVAAHSSATVVLTAPAGSAVRLQLTGRDVLALDDDASFVVPNAAGIPSSLTVTLVGDPTSARPLAQALSSAPGVKLQLRTPASYRRSDALASDLVVLDGWLPASGLPPAPAVVLVAPPRIPGGSLGGTQLAPSVSGTAAGNDLLSGVDLRSLSVDRGAARVLQLPSWIAPVVWTPDGALLAAGDNGRQRVAVLAFDPPDSNLTQLPAFPILARNLERWSTGWASITAGGSLGVDAVPATTHATVSGGATGALALGFGAKVRKAAGVTGLAPGAYSVAASGSGVAHARSLTASLAAPAAATAQADGAIDLTSWARASAQRSSTSLTPFLVALGLLAIGSEWLLWRRFRRA